jgi:hypothetical protein
VNAPAAPAPARVLGPIAGDRPPAGAPDVDLDARGYVVEEFHLEGEATAYHLARDERGPVDGRWEVEPYASAPYRTRLLVVRPARADACNGTVVVNWQNVSAGYEQHAPNDGEVYEGYVWVGVSAQEVGLYGFPAGMERMASRRGLPLLEHDADRYGDLHHPGDPACFDIFSAAGLAVGPGRDGDVDPLGGLPVERVVATGGSQSAMRLAAYLNAFHPSARVYDGFLLSVWEARAPLPHEAILPMGQRTALRTDTATPVIVVNSEFESTHLAQVPCVDTEWLRIWEVAGTPHGNARSRVDAPDRRGRVANRLRWAPVHEAALRALHGWVRDGVAAPHLPRIEMDPGPPLRARVDDVGNAVGGVRLPELEAPTARYQAMAMGTGRLPLFGAATPLADDELRARYVDRADYERRWHAAVEALVASGALRPEDAPAMHARVADVRLPFDRA